QHSPRAVPMADTTRPFHCGNIHSDYYFLCDTDSAWGIVLESLAAAGIIVCLILIFTLLFLICKVQDSSKRSMISIQFLFLLGTLGLFGLTFAFIIKLNDSTGPTRFFLFGVLFALCFSCLLTHAFNLIKLVRGKTPMSWIVMLAIVAGLTMVQVIIAILYIVITVVRYGMTYTMSDAKAIQQRNMDFVMLLIYVLFLMALIFLVSMFTFCGPYRGWKRHGAHIYVTILFSIAIWVVWITMLIKGNRDLSKQPLWDDPVVSIALVANAWVFLMMYIVPELCFLTAPCKPEDYPPENDFCQPKHMKKRYGVENKAYTQEEIVQGMMNCVACPCTNLEPQKEFSIPRPKTRLSPYEEYTGGRGVE
uniref:G-protein coupled receptors family 3 profile domain-containing protein n=1 Tax=Sphenodon punctatus TaxID=8508 RepID=A0A8D0GIN8_SPHPU